MTQDQDQPKKIDTTIRPQSASDLSLRQKREDKQETARIEREKAAQKEADKLIREKKRSEQDRGQEGN
jgi:hypothetical protein